MAGPVNTVTGSCKAAAIAAASVKASSRVKGPSGAEDSETAQNGKVSGVIGGGALTHPVYHTCPVKATEALARTSSKV